jgi:flagellar biosynthetic protein FliR
VIEPLGISATLDGLLRAELGSFALEVSRITGLVVVCPILFQNAPKTVKAALVIFLSVLVHGHGEVSQALSAVPELAVFAIFSELALGAAMGMVVRLALSAAEIAANSAAPLIGFGTAQIFDPTSGHSDTVLATLMRSLAFWIALLTGLHHVVIGTLIASFRAVPVGSLISPARAYPILLQATSTILATGLRLALPLLAVLFMVQIALGFVSRAAPAMQIFSVGFAFTLVIGGVVLALSLPDVARELTAELSNVGAGMEAVLLAARGD